MLNKILDILQHFNFKLMHTTLKNVVIKTFYTLTQCTVHTPHRSQYAAITLTTFCTASTYLLLNKCVIFS